MMVPLRCTYGTILFLELDDNYIANLRFLLICFDIFSGLKINFLKSEVIVKGVSQHERPRVALMLCKEGSFPPHLPRISIHSSKTDHCGLGWLSRDFWSSHGSLAREITPPLLHVLSFEICHLIAFQSNVWVFSYSRRALMVLVGTQLGTPRGRYDEHISKFPSVVKPKFNRTSRRKNHTSKG
jgi:hypothetical protein